MRLWVRSNGLSLFFFVLFAGALVGQSLAGQRVFNEEQLQHGGEPISYARYLVSSHFGSAVLENWQSEYPQFTLFILATVLAVRVPDRRLDGRLNDLSAPARLAGIEAGRSPARPDGHLGLTSTSPSMRGIRRRVFRSLGRRADCTGPVSEKGVLMATRDATERPVGERMERTGVRLTGTRSETKWAPLTTEFWAMVGVIVATLVAAAVADNFDAPRAWVIVGFVAAAYIVSRGLAKAGNAHRGPYDSTRD